MTNDPWDYQSHIDNIYGREEFQNPGGRSALRRATKTNRRNLPSPDCSRINMLTARDKQLGYRCNICADQAEGLIVDTNY